MIVEVVLPREGRVRARMLQIAREAIEHVMEEQGIKGTIMNFLPPKFEDDRIVIPALVYTRLPSGSWRIRIGQILAEVRAGGLG